jgi:ABC-type transport system involved in cytochrome c biogenesis permease subunit
VTPNPTLVTISQFLLLGTFICYVAAALLYTSGTLGQRFSKGEKFSKNGAWGTAAHTLGVLFHGAAILTRWQGAGHWPTSNMYEFIGFMAFTSMLAFLVIHRMYRMDAVGALVVPVGVFLLAYSYVFPPKVTPLVPALKSYWLPMHVSMAALGEGFFAVAFGAALLYLLRVRGLELAQAEAGAGAMAVGGGAFPPAPETKEQRFERTWGLRGMEALFYVILVMVGFTVLALALRWTGQQWVFGDTTYTLPPLIGPALSTVGEKGNLFGVIPMPLVVVPIGFKGKQWNTLLYSLVLGWILYTLIRRFIAKGPIGDALARRVGGDPEVLDEISYRAVAIGYPVFTLGGLVFAMLWAKEAWGRYWFFDPKETWALIAWLVYSAYLHFRITKGWEGRKSAWIAVLGFGVVLFTLVGVNLLIVGLHSYAGGDM